MFCKFCGRQIGENETCTCAEAVEEAAKKAAAYQALPQTPPQETPQTPPQNLRQAPPQGIPQTPPQGSWQAPPQGTPQTPPQGSWQAPPQGIPQTPPQGPWQAPPQGTPQTPPQGSWQAPPQGTPQTPSQGPWQAPPQGTWQPPKQKAPSVNFQEAANSIKNNPVLNQIAALIKNMIKEPVRTLRDAYQTPDKMPQFLVGALYAVSILLFVTTAMLQANSGFGSALGGAVKVILLTAALKGAHILAGWFFSGKTRSLKDISALFCLSSLPETLCLLIMFLMMLFGWSLYTPILIMAIVLMITLTTVNLSSFNIIFAPQQDKGYKVFLLLNLVLTAICFLIVQAVVKHQISSALSLFKYLF